MTDTTFERVSNVLIGLLMAFVFIGSTILVLDATSRPDPAWHTFITDEGNTLECYGPSDALDYYNLGKSCVVWFDQ